MSGVSRRDVEELNFISQGLRRAGGSMGSETAGVNRLIYGINQAIGGSATGKDQEFLQLLNGAVSGMRSAVSACDSAASCVAMAAAAAAAEVRETERRERESRRV